MTVQHPAGFVQPDPGPWNAVDSTPDLAPGAVRRTTSVDLIRPDGFDGTITADIRGRDLRRGPDGDDQVLGEVQITATIEEWSGRVQTIDGHDHPALASLVGVSLRRGWGRALAGAFAPDLAERTLLASILEDLGGALLVSGYAPLRRGLLGMEPSERAERAAAQQDICAGWAAGGELVQILRTTGNSAVPRGPHAAPLTAADAWHETDPTPVDTVSRIRALDVVPLAGQGADAAAVEVRAHFRDSYQGDGDDTMVMHEYLVHARVVGSPLVIDQVAVEPRVLPWSTCPSAVPSADRTVGTPIADLPTQVRAELVGPPTCTHLNSTLRSLADVARLVEAARP